MVEILLATYNGEKYLKTQLQSLVEQSYQDFHVTISDDGSVDGTVEIAKEFERLYPSQFLVRSNSENSGSASANFMKLLGEALDNDYVMLCDQDDFWEKEKIEYSLKAIAKMEKKYGKGTPILVHGDLTITDENLYVVEQSMFKHQKLNRHIKGFQDELSQNSITGCTVIVNRALLERVKVDCKNIIMHDWYLGLLASAFGQIGFMSIPFIKYRQHGSNSEGAKDFESVGEIVNRAIGRSKIKNSLEKTYLQAQGFKEAHYDELSEHNKELIDAYIALKDASKLKKWNIITKNKFTKSGISRKLGYWMYI